MRRDGRGRLPGAGHAPSVWSGRGSGRYQWGRWSSQGCLTTRRGRVGEKWPTEIAMRVATTGRLASRLPPWAQKLRSSAAEEVYLPADRGRVGGERREEGVVELLAVTAVAGDDADAVFGHGHAHAAAVAGADEVAHGGLRGCCGTGLARRDAAWPACSSPVRGPGVVLAARGVSGWMASRTTPEASSHTCAACKCGQASRRGVQVSPPAPHRAHHEQEALAVGRGAP